jgi:hypothetical protein
MPLHTLATCSSSGTDTSAERITWKLRILDKGTIAMKSFDQEKSLAENRATFEEAFFSGDAEAEQALDEKIASIFDIAERKKCDELLLIHSLASALFIGLQPRYAVASAVMVGLLPPNYRFGDPPPAAGVWPDKVLNNPLVLLAKKRAVNIARFNLNHEAAIKTLMAQLGFEENIQALSGCPPMSHAGKVAALNAIDEAVVRGFQRSRNIGEHQHLRLDESNVRLFLGDFEVYHKQLRKEQQRQQSFDQLHGLNSASAASVRLAIESQLVHDTDDALKHIETFMGRGDARLKESLDQFRLGVKRVRALELECEKLVEVTEGQANSAANEARLAANSKSISLAIRNFENFSDEKVSAEECFKKALSFKHRLQPIQIDDDGRNAAARASLGTIDSKLEAADNDTAQLDDNMNALSTMAFCISDPQFGGRRPRSEPFGLLKDFQGVEAERFENLFAASEEALEEYNDE